MLDQKLKTLLAVAEEKSFTKASLKLSLTQPAVSHQIQLLEEEYNVKIINRGKKEITLTREGEVIVNFAKKFKAMEEQMIGELHNLSIKIKMGITHTAESNAITEIVARFTKLNPNVSIIIITDTTPNLYKMVENYELDFAWVDSKITEANINWFPLDTDYLVCVLNNDNPLTKKEVITLNDLKKERLILRLKSSTTRKIFEASLEAINDSINNYNVVLEVDNIATIKDLIRKDFGISILSKSACMDEVTKKKLTILPIKDLSMERQNYVIYSNFSYNLPIIEQIVKSYQDEYKQLEQN